MASDQGEAEEVVQEAWLRAWRAFPRYKEDRPFINWLMRIAVNVARDRWRKKKPLDFADLSGSEVELQDLGPGPEERLTRKEALEHLIHGVERLRPVHRMVVALRYDAGHSYKEIADILDVPLNTVRTHLHRAKVALRTWMEVENDQLAG
jgi:RNA polymerase sigma-70 factor (ECF subfamily)